MTTQSKTNMMTKTAVSTRLVQTTTTTDRAQPVLASVERWQNTNELRWTAQQWAEHIDTKTSRIHVRPMTTKWASTSTAGRLTLNTNLLEIPKNLGEFVIVHELVHLLVPNHSKAFSRLLHTCVPDWRRRERELRRLHKEATGNPQESRRRTIAAPSSTTQPLTICRTDVTLPPVLVVDDEPAQRRLLRELFTLEGHVVHVAQHGGTALRRLRASNERMVVLLGLMMPKVDGEAVLEAVAADKALATQHTFIMVTAATSRALEGRVAELLRQLCIPLLAKPYTVTHIVDAVEEATRRLTASSTP
jgi:CheY-like chemotaxis protein